MAYSKKYFYSLLIFLTVLGSIFFSIYYLNKNIIKPPIQISKQDSSTNINKTALILMSMGNKRMIASLLWIHTLLESDLDQYKKNDLNSWMYLRFRTIAATDPRFYENYLYGSQYLSVIKDDELGADDLLTRGLKVYPNDFWLNYYLGFHAYFELGDAARAYDAYEHILNHPLMKEKIPFLPSLLARLKAEQGEIHDAYKLLSTAYVKTPESPLKTRYAQSLYAIKAQIDLKCLNNKMVQNCETLDWNGQPYKQDESGRYSANKPWQPFKISSKIQLKKPQDPEVNK